MPNRFGDVTKGEEPSWRARIDALRYAPQLLKLVWETNWKLVVAMTTLRVVRSLTPVAALWIGKLIIDAIVSARASDGDWRPVASLIAVEIAIVVASEVFVRLTGIVEKLLAEQLTIRISVRLMQHANSLDLAQFEDPAISDHLERARDQTNGRLGFLSQLLGIVQNTITLATFSVVLLKFNHWLVLLLAVTIIPGFISESRFAALQYQLRFSWTQKRRGLDYLRYLGASSATAKDVQLLGLGPWLTQRFQRLSEKWYEESSRVTMRHAINSTFFSLLSTAGYYGAYLMIVLQTVQGRLTLGTLTLLAGAFSRGRDLMQQVLSTFKNLYDESLYLRDLFSFFKIQPTISSSGTHTIPCPVVEGFVFENVGFRYPGSTRWAVRNITIHLRPSESVALVGENGAGKTTIAKLLARLYDPTEGRILLDGRDLRTYDIVSLRKAFGVIFQDFVHYDFRFNENVGVGDIEAIGDELDKSFDSAGSRIPAAKGSNTNTNQAHNVSSVSIRTTALDLHGTHRRMQNAVDDSLAASIIPRLPMGWAQMLGRRFDDGVELSGGEWQKVALARAYIRDTQFLLLDEPTSALDARTEFEVFRRFHALSSGKISLVISHRFSTVRKVDRIVVLQNGSVIDQGSHDELTSRDGLYHELFGLQASAYR